MELLNVQSVILVLFYSIIQVAAGCSSTASCLYTAWYFWFLLFWVVFFIGMAVLYCWKKHQKQHRTIEVKPPELTRAKSPPPYSAPSHLPPAYTPTVPHGTMTSHAHTYNNPVYTPGSVYPPQGPPQYGNDPAYPPQGAVYPPQGAAPY